MPDRAEMSHDVDASADYADALRQALERPDELDFGKAYEFGRTALDQRRGLIDLVMLHHAALTEALPPDVAGRGEMLLRAGEFLAECLAPHEMAYRGFLEANAALVGVNGTLEREGRRIARLLHDGAGQFLFRLQMVLADLDRDIPPHLAPALAEINDLVRQLDEQLHLHSRELYPVVLDDLGLAAAIHQLIGNVKKRSDLAVSFDGHVRDRFSSEVESALYRSVQEALTNVIKHARARHVSVTLTQADGQIRCSVADDGIGGVTDGPTPEGGLGLTSIRERLRLIAGALQIQSAPGAGTKLIFTAPVQYPVDGHQR